MGTWAGKMFILIQDVFFSHIRTFISFALSIMKWKVIRVGDKITLTHFLWHFHVSLLFNDINKGFV